MNIQSLFSPKSLSLLVCGIGLVHLAAFFVNDSVLESVLLLVVGVMVFFFGVKYLPFALGVSFVELFVGGHGHLLAAEVFGFALSLRMVLFLATFSAFFVHVLKERRLPEFVFWRDIGWVLLGFSWVIALILGLFVHRFPGAFDDANGYMYALYFLPIVFIRWSARLREMFAQLFIASVLWLSLFTALLSYLFTHLPGKQLDVLYRFVRDSRLAEVTLQTVSNSSGVVLHPWAEVVLGTDGYWYRIFMQSQIFLVVALLFLIAYGLFQFRGQRLPWGFYAFGAVLGAGFLMSFSRSFLLGFLVVVPCIYVASLFSGKKRVYTAFTRTFVFSGITILSVALSVLFIVFPLPSRSNIHEAAFYKSASDSSRELAVSSRWQLLSPMLSAVRANPVLGYGYGREVTFISDDPRVRALVPSGEWTTYRFEWGFVDIWLKMGVLGLLAYGVILGSLGLVMFYEKPRWVAVAAFASVVFVFCVHMLTPYLNHPLGIGLLLFLIPFFEWRFPLRSPVAFLTSKKHR